MPRGVYKRKAKLPFKPIPDDPEPEPVTDLATLRLGIMKVVDQAAEACQGNRLDLFHTLEVLDQARDRLMERIIDALKIRS